MVEEKKEPYLDGWLIKKLDNVKRIIKKGWDCVILVDGIEGVGKSTLGQSIGWYINHKKLETKNISENSQDAITKLEKLPNKSVLIIDEGSLLFSSKDAMTKEQKNIIKILQVIRQKNMCLIIVAPSFFDLNKYIAVERSRFLLHCYTDKELNRGRFSYFGEKKKRRLYQMGKKNFNSYAKPKADFLGRFGDYDFFGQEYKDMKVKNLMETFKQKKQEPHLDKVVKIVGYIKERYPDLTSEKIGEVLGVSRRTIHTYLAQYRGEKREIGQNIDFNLGYCNNTNVIGSIQPHTFGVTPK